MAKRIRRFGGFKKEQLEEEIPYSWLVFTQLDRVFDAMTERKATFLTAVEASEMSITPFVDDKYLEDSQRLEEEYSRKLRSIQGKRAVMNLDDEDKMTVAAYEKAKIKQKMIMRLIGRIGMLPKTLKAYDEVKD